jgi:hypothetical protein
MASIALESQSLGGFQLLDARHERKIRARPVFDPNATSAQYGAAVMLKGSRTIQCPAAQCAGMSRSRGQYRVTAAGSAPLRHAPPVHVMMSELDPEGLSKSLREE